MHFGCRRAPQRSAEHTTKFVDVESFLSQLLLLHYFFFGRLLAAVVHIKYQRLLITLVLTYVIAKWLQSSRAQLHLVLLHFQRVAIVA